MTKPVVRVKAGETLFVDGFANMVASIGQANHKHSGNTYLLRPENEYTIDVVYRTSAFFKKIIDIRPRDSVRRWRQWQADNAVVELIEEEEKKLDVKGAILKALTLQRKYGGALIVALGLPGENDQELRLDSVGKGSLKSLVVLSRHDVSIEGVVTDPLSEFYGHPNKYTINSADGNPVYIHPSRVIPFKPTIQDTRINITNFWGDSLWQSLEDAVVPVDASGSILADLMREAKIDIVQVPNMWEKLATDKGEKALVRRFTLVNIFKSVGNAMLMDKDDEWTQKTINWTGLPEVVHTQMQIMAGASGYPLTRLMGIQAKGLGNDGQADLRLYYDDVQQEQELDITPTIRRLDEWIIRSATGTRDPSIWYNWRSLWQMSAKEIADIDKIQAETVEKIVNTGLFDPRALAQSVQARMIESGSWPALEQAIDEIGNEPNPEDDLPDDEEGNTQ